MANIKKNDKDKKQVRKVMVIPRDNKTYEEKYAIANGKKIPFEIPITLNEKDIKAIEHQKEAHQVDNIMTVPDVMNKYSCTQAEAVKIVEAQSHHKEIGGKKIVWRPKYMVQNR